MLNAQLNTENIKIRILKHEIRNNVQISKIQMFKTRVLDFGDLDFEFVSNFDIRASDLK